MHRLGLLSALTLLAIVGLMSPATANAADGLVVSSRTVYDVQPDRQRAVVSVDVTVTNVRPDTDTQRFYYTGISLGIPIEATAVSAQAAGRSLQVNLTNPDEAAQSADVTFGVSVFYRQTFAFRLQFTLPDAGGDPGRPMWIRRSFVSLPIWSYGSDGSGASSVEVVFPPGYEVEVPFGEMRVVVVGDATTLVADAIDDPAAFFAYATAESTTPPARKRLTVALADGPASLMLLAWPDDPAWAERQAGLLELGLPVLETSIGIPYPIVGVLTVTEQAYEHLGDYGGAFLANNDEIAMRFDADAFTALHEAAHLWFNGRMTEERWLLEGFADYYAAKAADKLGEQGATHELTAAVSGTAFPLIEWGDPFVEDVEREEYGYAASAELARQIADLAGDEALRSVWAAMTNDRLAYAQDAGDRFRQADERPEDWQRLLDLFENETQADFEPLWIEWVLGEGPDELSDRNAARDRYDDAQDYLGAWPIPRSTRLHMETWEFDQALADIDELESLVDDFAEVRHAAEGIGLTPADEVGARLASDGLDGARTEVGDQATAIEAIEVATRAAGEERSFIRLIGLIGEPQPNLSLDAARSAFEAGDDAIATERARQVEEELRGADERGGGRVAIGGGMTIFALGTGAFAVAARRRRARGQTP